MKENSVVSHVEFLVLLVTLLGGFYLLDGKIDHQSARTDRLYEMYCETQKEIKQLHKDMKDELIDMKKEQYEFMKKHA